MKLTDNQLALLRKAVRLLPHDLDRIERRLLIAALDQAKEVIVIAR